MSPRGGLRHGAGRPAEGKQRKIRRLSLSDAEHETVERIFGDELGLDLPQAIRALAAGEWVPIRKDPP